MPRWVYPLLALCFVGALIPLVLIARSREVPSPRTRIAIVQDMGKQPKYRPQSENPMFADDRAMRLPVAGTVAREGFSADERYTRGVDGGQWTKIMPVPVDMKLMRRGQERFGIYCSVCHGLSGDGKGMIDVRMTELVEQNASQHKWVHPADLRSDAVRSRDLGQIFDTITNGVRNMPPYGSQIDIPDRWAIVAYVRALQRSQHASVEDVPGDKRNELR